MVTEDQELIENNVRQIPLIEKAFLEVQVFSEVAASTKLAQSLWRSMEGPQKSKNRTII